MSEVSAIVKDGQVTNLKTESTKKSSAPSGYDKDAFMNILVAQMKYQDPLEPTSNTEYISQYAQFTQVEQLSNMANATTLSRASDLVGKTVIMSQEGDDGVTTEIKGQVDYVTYQGDKAYLHINGNDYDMEDLKQVIDSDFAEADETITSILNELNKLPELDDITVAADGERIHNIYTKYDALSEKGKNMLDSKYVTAIEQYVSRLNNLITAASENSETEDTTDAATDKTTTA